MANTPLDDAATPSLLFVETATGGLDTPVAGDQRLGIDPTTHTPYMKDSAGLQIFLMQRLRNAALTTPSNLANGDVWVEATGTSPSRVVTLKLRDGGSTVTLLTIIY